MLIRLRLPQWVKLGTLRVFCFDAFCVKAFFLLECVPFASSNLAAPLILFLDESISLQPLDCFFQGDQHVCLGCAWDVWAT